MTVWVSDHRGPVPDVMVRPPNRFCGNVCKDMIVAFEVLSESTKRRDLGWKRSAYARLPSLQRYVVVAQKTVTVLSKVDGWTEEKMTSFGETLRLPELAVELSLRSIYRNTGLA